MAIDAVDPVITRVWDRPDRIVHWTMVLTEGPLHY
jgi:hypothetical protein